jgi:hypothetical protein
VLVAVMLENLIKRRIREDEILRFLVEGTVSETGTEFFRALARNLSEALQTCGAWVTEYLPESRRLRALAFWISDRFLDHFEYAIDGTACQSVLKQNPAHIFLSVCWISFPMTRMRRINGPPAHSPGSSPGSRVHQRCPLGLMAGSALESR